MSFIDRMLQDMLHRNMSGRGAARMARKAVRRIGTRRLLMMGGAALAGGLLTEAARRQGAASPTVPAGGGQAPPPLPPVPGRSGVASPPPGLPPLPVPGAAGAPPAAEEPPVLDLPPGTLFAALRTMVAAALSDGELSAEERELIESRLAESGLPAERVAQVRRDLVLPATPAELAALLPEGEPPELLLELAILVVRADGEIAAHESAWLRQLAAALGVGEAKLDELQRELLAED
jgi:hypothetical protein